MVAVPVICSKDMIHMKGLNLGDFLIPTAFGNQVDKIKVLHVKQEKIQEGKTRGKFEDIVN